MRIGRTQINQVESYGATWTHPTGMVWQLLGTVVIPGGNRTVILHTTTTMRLLGTLTGMAVERNLSLTMATDTGPALDVVVVGHPGALVVPGDTLSYASDLPAADLEFSVSAVLVGLTVEVAIYAQCPGLLAGQKLDVSAEVWWE